MHEINIKKGLLEMLGDFYEDFNPTPTFQPRVTQGSNFSFHGQTPKV